MIVVVDNYDSFTWNLVQRIGELDPSLALGEDLVVLRNDAFEPAELETIDDGGLPSHIIISPGPGTPDEAGVSGAVIERSMGRVPVLGVCLGHQCLAANHALPVVRHRIQMHGKTSLIHHDGQGLFAGLSNPFTATRYHSLVVPRDSVPPDGEGWQVSAHAIETTEDGSEIEVVMGLRFRFAEPDKIPVEGVQFHPESFLTDEGPQLLANFLRSGPRPLNVSLPSPPASTSPAS